MKELITDYPLVIEGDPLSRANISMDYRLKNVPVHRIENKQLANKKKRWDLTNNYKDLIAWTLRSRLSFHGQVAIPKGHPVAICLKLVFSYKKKGGLAQNLIKDMDNCEKLIYDAFENSGAYSNDCQIIQKLVLKDVCSRKPRLEIYSLAQLEPGEPALPWIVHSGRRLSDHEKLFNIGNDLKIERPFFHPD